MLRRKKTFFVNLFFFLFSLSAFATHLVGGEIYYTFLGNTSTGPYTYRITLKIYRDCYNGQAQLDDPGYIQIFTADGAEFLGVEITPVAKTLPNVSQVACAPPPSNVCVEEGLYEALVNLPPVQGGYDLVYQRCCRNYTIKNIQNPQTSGSTYLIHVNDQSLAPGNSSPRYKLFPPLYLCVDQPLIFDHAAIDPDGDSLVYDLCDPFLGASDFDPKPDATSPPPPPPYDFVVFKPPYSATYPIAANPGLGVDPSTGKLTVTPTEMGQYVVGVCVKEYRNGVLLSNNKRDFQFNVIQCQKTVKAITEFDSVASGPGYYVLCDGLTVQFQNNSFGADSYYWDFGDPTKINDNSTATTPFYTYPDSGKYTVMLVAINSQINCRDTTYVTIKVYDKLSADFSVPAEQCQQGSKYNFSVQGQIDPSATFLWDFGGNSIPLSSTQQEPTNVHFTKGGYSTVTVTVKQFGCSTVVTKQVRVIDEPVAAIAPQSKFCEGVTYEFLNNSINAQNYYWNFGDPVQPGSGSTEVSPIFTYADTGNYTVTLVAVNEGKCYDTLNYNIAVMPLLKPLFSKPANQCEKNNSFDFTAGGIYKPTTQFNWQFPWAAPLSSTDQDPQNVQFFMTGKIPVTLTYVDFGCIKTFSDTVYIVKQPKSGIAPQQDSCIGFTYSFENLSTDATSWKWIFNDITNTTSSDFSPTFTFSDSGRYNVQLIAINEGICYDTAYSTFYVYPLLQPAIGVDRKEACLTDNGFNFKTSGFFGSSAIFDWQFAGAEGITSSVEQVPSTITYGDTGLFHITLSVAENNCKRYDDEYVRVFPALKVNFGMVDPELCYTFPIQFIDSSFSSTPLEYTWNFGDGNFSDEQNPTHTYATPGTYTINLEIRSDSGCVDTLYMQKKNSVIIRPLPIPGFSTTPERAPVTEPFIKITDESKNAISCIIKTESQTFNNCSFLHTYHDTGFFEIQQIVVNEFGCKDSLLRKIYIIPEYRLWRPNAFSPNGDGMNDSFYFPSLGVKEFKCWIYDRWGNLVYYSEDVKQAWDGKMNGRIVEEDVYVYKVEIIDVFKEYYNYTGTITVVR